MLRRGDLLGSLYVYYNILSRFNTKERRKLIKLGSSCGNCQNSILTRIAYALILLLNSLLSWLMLTGWATKKLQGILLDYVTIDCAGKSCFGFAAVHRINFALGVFHFLLVILLLGVNNSRDKRAPIQNGFWGPKIVAWLGLIVLSFLIPNRFFEVWGNYVALVGAILFLLLGLVLLVDLAHTFAEYCIEKIEENDSGLWRGVLIGATLGMYLGSIALTIVMYIFFAHSGCSMNQAAITVNLILLLAISAMSVHPSIQASNPRAGLAQAATVSIYCTYLTFSAVAMEPDDQHCNPLVRAQGTRTASIVLGAVVTFVTCAYTTTRAATYGLALGTGKPAGYSPVVDSEEASTGGGGHGMVDTQPESRKAMRQEALRRAVQEGVLPASALDDDEDDEDDDKTGKNKNDDEKNGTQYNYALFHVIFMLATAWIATLLTQNVGSDVGRDLGDFVPVGRTYWASWVKIVSSWVCYGIFGWTLGAPVWMPERFDYS
ncbi:Membrane protein tms1 [Friedmanniomyces endolithicus]|uniref:Membrane protein tms1 n=1 Tax=Friedmanniomyces endolithicus TaxID=329885 RepID=A0AAN6HC19_9PEZI|nr:Membrane protein tms1 [Friedmanniomyces endolithicus]KAK0777627.1 Membrane protein tms1 [Friedmanniomyces endolithicus]KAK0782856.1 Membrane protein tms1 [Friedmanniomyces endolithicus]KAK0788368.1 Membrane protein tms1 [Friedmanniomyces endolithicus]KAK0836310.1 Membrane protein tms1 [Friedmanniomyces endolithicus]